MQNQRQLVSSSALEEISDDAELTGVAWIARSYSTGSQQVVETWGNPTQTASQNLIHLRLTKSVHWQNVRL